MTRPALVVLTLVCGELGFVAGHHGRAPRPRAIAAVLVAARDLERGQPIAPSDVAVAVRPVSPGLLLPHSERLAIGHSPTVRLRAGDPLDLDALSDAAAVVPRKGRAATFDISARVPTVKPGDHIDVQAALPEPQNSELTTVTLLQNVVVLATLPVDAGTLRLTVLLIPEEAELLMEARRLGTLDVSLRNPEDVDWLEERGHTTAETLIAGERTRVLTAHRFHHCMRFFH